MKNAFLTAFLLFPSFGLAQTTKPADDPCRKATSASQLSQCNEQKYRTADAQLLKTYQRYLLQLQKRLDTAQDQAQKAQFSKTVEDLKAAELAWMSYRDAHCTAESDLYERGELRSGMNAACLETLTRARISQLDDTYSDK